MAFRTPFPTIKSTTEPDTTISKFKTPFPGGTSIIKQVEYQPTSLKISAKDVLKEVPKAIISTTTKMAEEFRDGILISR